MVKKALCIGINDYPGTGSDLSGCVNDAADWKTALEQRGFAVQQLMDKQATKQAMLQGIQSLVQEAKSGDVVCITYSGHGSWIPDV
ncbi:MAG TPA: caspase family protein, partial [Candidatus Brocadiales bacterium]|nr:caspase family protein [Candidatus Brocadiales bacterium]